MFAPDSVTIRDPQVPSEAQADEGQVALPYREPQLFALGTAIEVLRSGPEGNCRDFGGYGLQPWSQ